MYLLSFPSLAALLVWFSGQEPEWAAPLTLVLIGVLTAAAAWFTSGRSRGARGGRIRLRLDFVAAVPGLAMLLCALGRL